MTSVIQAVPVTAAG